MDGNYQDDDKQDTENADTADEGARDESEPTDEADAEPEDEAEVAQPTPVDEAVESMTLLSLARGMASGEITRDAGRTWLAENHPD